MHIMAKNSQGIFSKISTFSVNYAGTVYDLRQKLESAVPSKLKGKKFELLTETLEGVDTTKEKQLTVGQVYSSDCVLIKWVDDVKGW